METLTEEQIEELEKTQIATLEEKINPHAAIIARHAARKAEREKQEQEEALRIEKEETEKQNKLKRRETLKLQQEELLQKHNELLSQKPLQPKQGVLFRYEGKLSGWKERHFTLEDKVPIFLECRRSKPDSEILETYQLGSEAVVEEDNLESSSSGSNGNLSGTLTSTKLTLRPSKSRSHCFRIIFPDSSLKLSAESAETKTEWMNFIQTLLEKHHSLVYSVVPKHSPSSSSSSLNKYDKETSPQKTEPTKDSKSKDKDKSRKSSLGVEIIANPLSDDEFVGNTLKNELFEV